MTVRLRVEVLPTAQRNAWTVLSAESAALNRFGFYLAGGTALALQLGHRRSLDFDFFSTRKRLGRRVQRWRAELPGAVLRDLDSDTAHADLQGVKLSFIGAYRYPAVRTPLIVDGIRLASVLDIALMKLLAVTHRAVVRDYVDLAAVIRDRIPLSTLVRQSRRKYGPAFNPLLALKALVSFEDLDSEQPALIDKRLAGSWQTILRQAVKTTA